MLDALNLFNRKYLEITAISITDPSMNLEYGFSMNPECFVKLLENGFYPERFDFIGVYCVCTEILPAYLYSIQ